VNSGANGSERCQFGSGNRRASRYSPQRSGFLFFHLVILTFLQSDSMKSHIHRTYPKPEAQGVSVNSENGLGQDNACVVADVRAQ